MRRRTRAKTRPCHSPATPSPARIWATTRSTYDGAEKPLVTATGKASGGEMHYALGTKDAATQPYTTSAPSKTGAGTYHVWYKVFGDDNHTDSGPAYVPVTIEPRSEISRNVTFKVVNGSWDDGTAADKTVTLTGFEGDTLKLTADRIPAVGSKPGEGYQSGSWDADPTAETTKDTYTYTYAQAGDTVTPEQTTEKTPEQTPAAPDRTVMTEAAAEAAILSMKNDNDLAFFTYGDLQVQQKRVSKTSVTIGWKRVPGASHYTVYGGKCGARMKKITTVNGTKYTAKKLKKGTYYKFIVVACGDGKALATGKVVHIATTGGKVGNVTRIRTNKNTYKIKKGKTAKIRYDLKTTGKVKKHRKISFESTNTGVAKVTKAGKIKGVGKGKCYVWIYAQNGVGKRVRVVVK